MTNGSTFDRLRRALVNWRAAERKHAAYVLKAAHPLDIKSAADAEAYALREVRLIVDSEPWALILQESNDRTELPARVTPVARNNPKI